MIPEGQIVVAPMPTPFGEDDSVDFGAIERNTARWVETSLSGFVLNSENGEEAFLSESERLQIVRVVAGVAGESKLIVGGIDSPSVTETLRTADALVEAGADVVRVRIPRLTDNVGGYFEEVLPRISVPVVIIHQPAPGMFGASQMPTVGSPQTHAELTRMENVFGYIAGGNIRFESVVRRHVPDGMRFWIGNGVLLLPGAAIGANGGCLMLGNVAPDECHDIIRLGQAGDLNAARAVQDRITDLDWMILGHGAAGIKAALELQGFEMSAPRRPSLPLGEAEVRELQVAMAATGLV